MHEKYEEKEKPREKPDTTDFYNDRSVTRLRFDDEIDLEEEAFMKGYLEADEEYEEKQ